MYKEKVRRETGWCGHIHQGEGGEKSASQGQSRMTVLIYVMKAAKVTLERAYQENQDWEGQ